MTYFIQYSVSNFNDEERTFDTPEEALTFLIQLKQKKGYYFRKLIIGKAHYSDSQQILEDIINPPTISNELEEEITELLKELETDPDCASHTINKAQNKE